ncbi:MAG: hypothetical protein U1C33_06020 [Candidatus Cloacimonadaceae bacterium]|nr:hypothetical protein [Candidatus Cloacimonadaceae bacterium]
MDTRSGVVWQSPDCHQIQATASLLPIRRLAAHVPATSCRLFASFGRRGDSEITTPKLCDTHVLPSPPDQYPVSNQEII